MENQYFEQNKEAFLTMWEWEFGDEPLPDMSDPTSVLLIHTKVGKKIVRDFRVYLDIVKGSVTKYLDGITVYYCVTGEPWTASSFILNLHYSELIEVDEDGDIEGLLAAAVAHGARPLLERQGATASNALTDDPYVVEYSYRNQDFHIQRLSEAVEKYRYAIAFAIAENSEHVNDYLPIGILATHEEAQEFLLQYQKNNHLPYRDPLCDE